MYINPFIRISAHINIHTCIAAHDCPSICHYQLSIAGVPLHTHTYIDTCIPAYGLSASCRQQLQVMAGVFVYT